MRGAAFYRMRLFFPGAAVSFCIVGGRPLENLPRKIFPAEKGRAVCYNMDKAVF